jgi:hypothetical protein
MMQWDKAASYVVTLLCFAISVRAAFAFFIDKPRLFSAIAMFALSWAVLLPYYGSDITSEMLPAFNGFLLGYAGALLIDESRARHPVPNAPIAVDLSMKVMLTLLLIVAFPSLHSFGIDLDLPIEFKNFDTFKTELVINLFITVVSYFVLGLGLLRFSRSKDPHNPIGYLWATFVVLVVYFGVSAYFDGLIIFGKDLEPAPTGDFWKLPSQPPMTTGFRVAFAICKVLLTFLFLQILTWTETSQKHRTPETAFEYVIRIAKFWHQGEL